MQFFRSLHTVKAMTFDLDDTLYNNEPIIQRAERSLQQHIRTHHPRAAALTTQQWLDLKSSAIATQPALASDMGQLRLTVLRQALTEDAQEQTWDEAKFNDAVMACFHCFYNARSQFTLAQEIHTTLKALSERMPLIAITNGNVNAKAIGIDTYFDDIYHANLSRPMKPSPVMFEQAAAKLGIAPKHILHVGDNLQKDVYASINAGFQSAWYACNRPMTLQLEKVSVLPHVVLNDLSELLAF